MVKYTKTASAFIAVFKLTLSQLIEIIYKEYQ